MHSFAHNLDSADGSLSGSSDTDFTPIDLDIDVALPSLLICRLKLSLSYANAEFFMDEVLSLVRAAPSRLRWFILRFDSIDEVDYVAAKMLMELADRMVREQVELVFAELSPNLKDFLSDCGVLEVIGLDKVFASGDEAFTACVNLTPNAKQVQNLA